MTPPVTVCTAGGTSQKSGICVTNRMHRSEATLGSFAGDGACFNPHVVCVPFLENSEQQGAKPWAVGEPQAQGG